MRSVEIKTEIYYIHKYFASALYESSYSQLKLFKMLNHLSIKLINCLYKSDVEIKAVILSMYMFLYLIYLL